MSQLSFLLLGLPLIVVVVAAVLGRWSRLVSLLGAATAVFVWWQLGSSEPSVVVFGSYTFDLSARLIVLQRLLYGITAVLYGLAWFWSQGNHFVSTGFVALVAFSLALAAPTFILAAFFLCMGLASFSMLLQAGRPQATPAALRFLLFVVPTLPLFLLLDWLFALGRARSVIQVFVIICLLLLAGFPFFTWVSRLTKDVPLGAVIFVVGVGQTAVLAFLFQFLSANEWIVADEMFRQLLRWSGVATVLVAGILGASTNESRSLLGAILLLDMGFALLTLTFPASAGWETAVMLLLVRTISLLLAMFSLNILEAQEGQSPFGLLLLGYSYLSLLGLPLTIGFGGRWVVITAVAQQASEGAQQTTVPWLAIFLLLAMVANTYSLFRLFIQQRTLPHFAQPLWLRAVFTILLLAMLILAAFPQPLLAYAHSLAVLLS